MSSNWKKLLKSDRFDVGKQNKKKQYVKRKKRKKSNVNRDEKKRKKKMLIRLETTRSKRSTSKPEPKRSLLEKSEFRLVSKSASITTDISIELLRLKSTSRIHDAFMKIGGGRIGKSKLQDLFEAAMLASDLVNCPLIPAEGWVDAVVVPILKSSNISLDRDEIVNLMQLVRDVRKCFVSGCAKEEQNKDHVVRVQHVRVEGKAARLAVLEQVEPDLEAYDLCVEDVTVRVNRRHYEKLKRMFERSGSIEEDKFHKSLFCLLVRYRALRGGGVQGGGMQAAVPETVFNVLRDHFSVSFECFASPLNCRYTQFCSAFLDTDSAFGSVGSFWTFFPDQGSFQVNPPFDCKIIERCSNHIHELLSRAEKSSNSMSFVVMIPRWEHCKGWSSMSSSSFLRANLLLRRRDHGYCEGRQHARPTRYRIAPCDTSVFILQSSMGLEKWPPTESKAKSIVEAFRSKHVNSKTVIADKRSKKKKKKKILNAATSKP